MTGFDYQSAAATRAKYPHLTVFDTNERLEPKPWSAQYDDTDDPADRLGRVDFDNDDVTEFTVHARPSSIHPEHIVITIEELASDSGGLTVILGGERIFFRV